MEKPQARIPQDLQPSSGVQMILCVPDDPEWIAVYRSLIETVCRGRYWLDDGRQNSIKAAQAVAREVFNTMALCSLETRLQEITAAIQALSFNQSINQICCERIVPPDPMPPANPDDWPMPGTGQNPPSFPDPATYDDAMCAAVNGLLWLFRRYAMDIQTINLALLGLAAIVSILIALIPTGVTQIIGTVNLVTIAGALAAALVYSEALDEAAEQFVDWLDTNKENVVCFAYQAAQSNIDWLVGISETLASKLLELTEAAGIPTTLATVIANLTGDYLTFVSALLDSIVQLGENLDQPPTSWAVDCSSCYPDISFQDAFTTDPNGRCPWSLTRVTHQDDGTGNYYADMNARDIDDALAVITHPGWLSCGLSGGTYNGVIVEFDYARVEGTSGAFVLSAKDASDATMKTVWSVDPSSLTLGVWYHVLVYLPFDVLFTAGGTNSIISWAVATSTPRLRMGIDNVTIWNAG